jgi:hypothetical protein
MNKENAYLRNVSYQACLGSGGSEPLPKPRKKGIQYEPVFQPMMNQNAHKCKPVEKCILVFVY